MAFIHELKGPGQTLLSSSQFPSDKPEFEVRVRQHGQNDKLYRNVVHVYMAQNAYVIIRADNHVLTFSMDKVRLDIN